MPQYVHVNVQPGGFAVVLLEREPVNLMDLLMWQQLMAALDQLEADQVTFLSLRFTLWDHFCCDAGDFWHRSRCQQGSAAWTC